MAMARTQSASVQAEFQRVIQDSLLRTQFQPIVSVESREVAGYECLVRGPVGSSLESADALINEAYRQNRVVEFDWVARAAAGRAAMAANLGSNDMLFVNIEPLALKSS